MTPMMLRNLRLSMLQDEADDKGGGGGGGETPEQKAAREETERKAKEEADRKAKEGGSKPTDAEAKLLKEVMQKKDALEKAQAAVKSAEEKLKQFEGIDPTEVKALLEQKRAADAAAKKAEEEAMAKKGEWDRLKSQMVEQHNKELEKERSEKTQVVEANKTLAQQIADLTVGNAFQTSPFIREEMALPPIKARVLFGQHFEFQDGKVVAFDKPAGTKDRTMLVDGKGEPLAFEDAMKKIIEADPEKDHLLKSKSKPGAGSGTLPASSGARKGDEGKTELKGSAKIAAGLAALNKGKK
jgi:hypothetical protein